MRSTYVWKSSLILGYAMTIGAVMLAYTTPATGYELSIYWSTPIGFWVLTGCSLLLGAFLSFRGTPPRTPSILLIGASFTAIVLLPIFRGYTYFREGDTMTHLGLTRDVLAGQIAPTDILYPGVHVLSAQMHNVTGVPVKHAIFLTVAPISLLFLLFVPLSIRVVSTRQFDSLIGLFASMMFLPLLQNGPLGFSPRFQAYFITPVLLFSVLSMFKYNARRYFLLSIIIFTTLTTFHPQQSMHGVLVIGAIAVFLRVRRVFSRSIVPLTQFVFPLSLGVGAIFWVYIKDNDRFIGSLQSYFYQFATQSPGSEVTSPASSVSSIGVPYYELILRIIVPNLVFSVFAGLLTVLIFIKKYRDIQTESLVVGVATVSGMFGLFLVLGSGALRTLGFLMVLLTILGTIGAIWTHDMLASYKRQLKPIVPLIVVGTFLISLLTLFNSPFILLGTGHVTDGQFDGYETTFEYTSREAPVDFVRSPSYRYYEGLRGTVQLETADVTVGDGVPDHFANQSLHSYYNETAYLAITSADYERDVRMYRGFRYSKQDFEYLRSAAGINKVYSSSDFRLYYIPTDVSDRNRSVADRSVATARG